MLYLLTTHPHLSVPVLLQQAASRMVNQKSFGSEADRIEDDGPGGGVAAVPEVDARLLSVMWADV